MINPIQKFKEWLEEELDTSKAKIPSACCLSTVGLDGFPNARFVALKDVNDGGFILTGPLSSRKGKEIDANQKVSLTFWWDESGRQVRVQGLAKLLDENTTRHYFSERIRESQIVSNTSRQGEFLENIEELNRLYLDFESAFKGKDIPKPDTWGGWSVNPIRIEFLEFNESRFHKRNLHLLEDGKWNYVELQP